ncbi:hydroxyacylglutathione hydrolase [Methylophaga sp. 42_25_T18]|nr:hydroxyacylglutathione hydrolase [Methylophaga sp. 42_25_T18]OUR85883.1 hydroxyacylglutathione hydrolase [Methylophaga sp. 42_8_T64]
MLNIQAVPALIDNYIWLIHSVDSNEIIIVDPGDATPVIKVITEQHLSPVAILNTHYHYDHVDGIAELVDRYQLPVYGPPNSFVPRLSTSLSATDKLSVHPKFPDFEVLEIPGHTATHIAYRVHDMVFCGDTLFASGCGRLLGGTAEQLFNSLQQICSLPTETKIYCGHEYTQSNLKFALKVEPNNIAIKQRIEDSKKLRAANLPTLPTTIAEELTTNPFLRCDQAEVIQAAQRFTGTKLTNPLAVFTALRAWKDRP